MNRAQLAQSMALMEGSSTREAARWLTATLECIARAVADGEEVTLTGFGTVCVSDRAAKMARNPLNGQMVHVDAQRVVRLRGATRLNAMLTGDEPVPPVGELMTAKAAKTPVPPEVAAARADLKVRLEADGLGPTSWDLRYGVERMMAGRRTYEEVLEKLRERHAERLARV